ncbi:hypothetical protein NAC44_06325 [Allorhizobium sp. BGMRC 0089]|uniref:hypothetical protein n=1 Tax=Allorhizobium sonneratiae TaxID=2934936 RepID=UPI00203350E8|nr:hypothetical protein [Allorhizobium sonneratiae]MCM2291944.1 hypothetical protein [Allorhizobium sonneratiae]
MTKIPSINHRGRPERRAAPTHLYSIGQIVRKKRGLPTGIGSPAETYHITATLPAAGNSLQYRMRSDNERYERVVSQDLLEPAFARQSDSASTLLEETFAHG